jgi:hypothetical protein
MQALPASREHLVLMDHPIMVAMTDIAFTPPVTS